jgi:predicted membrane-bound spermidine synthase
VTGAWGGGRRDHREPTAAQRATLRRRQNFEILIGVLGFFTVVAFVATAVAELHGDSSLRQALILAMFVVALGLSIHVRRRL